MFCGRFFSNHLPSMKQVSLNVKSRTEKGRNASKRLRGAGSIPAVIYGESGVRDLSVSQKEFSLAWRSVVGRAALIELHLDGAEESTFAIIQETQRNPRTDAFQHIDFKEVVRGKDMEAEIPVIAKGVSPGVKNGGILEFHAETLTVRCRPRDLPEAIAVDVTQMQIGDSLHVRDLPAAEGLTILSDDDLVVVACVGSSGGASAAADESDDEEEAAPAKSAEAKSK